MTEPVDRVLGIHQDAVLLDQDRQHARRKRVKKDEEKARLANCVADLHKAVLDAGGDPRGVLDMTLREFVVRVAAQNGIRFVHWPTHLRRHECIPLRGEDRESTGDPLLDELLEEHESAARAQSQ